MRNQRVGTALRHLVSISATVLTHAKAEMLTSEGVSLSVLKC
jgi:hypothetical protein